MKIEIPDRLLTYKAPKHLKTPWLTGRGTRWVVARNWWVCIDGTWFCVPEGYVFNGSSIPWWLWWLFPPTYDPAWEASCLHDWFYSHLWEEVSKAFADQSFRAIMLFHGSHPWVADRFYWAVCRFGKGGW